MAAVVSEPAQVLPAIKHHSPALVLLDMTLGRQTMLGSVREIVNAAKGGRVVVVSASSSMAMARQAIAAGAHAYLSKTTSPDMLRKLITSALAKDAAGEPVIMLGDLMKRVAGAPGVSIASRSQRRVLEELLGGRSQAETATLLGVSPKTVEYHLKALRHKTGLRTTAQLLAWARETGGLP